MVNFYGSNSWSYSRLGRNEEGSAELETILSGDETEILITLGKRKKVVFFHYGAIRPFVTGDGLSIPLFWGLRQKENTIQSCDYNRKHRCKGCRKAYLKQTDTVYAAHEIGNRDSHEECAQNTL